MKRFRIITVMTLAAIAMLVAANIVYLHGLYESFKEQTVQTATDCLRRADILEIISRMKGTQYGDDESFIRVTLMIQGEKSGDGGYEYPNLLENVDNTMSNYFHFIASNTPDMQKRDNRRLTELFRKELHSSGIQPKYVDVSESINPNNNDKYWEICIRNSQNEPLVYGYISPLTGY